MNIGLRNLTTFGAVESWSGYFEATDPSGHHKLDLGSRQTRSATSCSPSSPITRHTTRSARFRTHRHKLIRHYGDRLEPVLPTVDDSPSKSLLIDAGWGAHPRPRVELYDLIMDPTEMRNLADVPEFAPLREELETRVQEGMEKTGDPLLDGPVPAPAGAFINDPAGVSATEPFLDAVD
jgi:hypothetical protein